MPLKAEPSADCGVGGAAGAALDPDKAPIRKRIVAGPWTGSWTESADNPSAAGVTNAMTGAIGAARARAAREHASRNAPLTRVSPSSYVHPASQVLAHRNVASIAGL
jgi:hypothetical protein